MIIIKLTVENQITIVNQICFMHVYAFALVSFTNFMLVIHA